MEKLNLISCLSEYVCYVFSGDQISKHECEHLEVFRDHQKVIDINSVISAVEILFHKEVAPTAGSWRFKNAA